MFAVIIVLLWWFFPDAFVRTWNEFVPFIAASLFELVDLAVTFAAVTFAAGGGCARTPLG